MTIHHLTLDKLGSKFDNLHLQQASEYLTPEYIFSINVTALLSPIEVYFIELYEKLAKLSTVGAWIPNMFGIRMVHSRSVLVPTIWKPN